MIKWIFDLARADIILSNLMLSIENKEITDDSQIIDRLEKIKFLINPSYLSSTSGDIHFGPENDT